MTLDVLKVLVPATVSFFVGILMTPILTHYLYKHQMWRKKVRDTAVDGRATPIFSELHKDKDHGTPSMGGVIVWGSVVITILLFWFLAQIDGLLFEKLNFLSRGQTWLPLFTLVGGAVIGFLDDFFVVTGTGDHKAGGLSLTKRLIVVFLISVAGAWWFFVKLGVSAVAVPFVGEINLGLLFIPFFMAVMMFIYSGGVIDGIDGLSGGVFSVAFSAYGLIAFFQNQIDLAAFSFVIAGGLLAFLWFNIPPARFYMTETGSMALTLTLTVIAFLTKQVAVLPLIALMLIITTLSVIIQVGSKKFRDGKKVFLVAPIHHHFEAIGWPGHKVAMRYWVISIISAILGIIIVILG